MPNRADEFSPLPVPALRRSRAMSQRSNQKMLANPGNAPLVDTARRVDDYLLTSRLRVTGRSCALVHKLASAPFGAIEEGRK